MRLLRWIAARGLRVTMTIALLVFAYHVLAELAVLSGRPRNLLQRLELTALDVKLAARGPTPPPRWRVAIAALDEKSVQEFGPPPWKRSVHARLVRRLTEYGAGAVAFDMTFDHPTTQAELELARRLKGRAGELGMLAVPGELSRAAELAERARERAEKLKKPPALRAPLAAELAPLAEVAEVARKSGRAVSSLAEELGAAAEGADPDGELIAAVKESGRVVLGLIALSRQEAESLGVPPAELAAALRLVSGSTLSELVSLGADGLEYIQPGAARAFDEGLYRRFFALGVPFAALAQATQHFGTINAIPDDDGVYRRLPLVASVKGSGVLIPALAVKAVEVAEGQRLQVVGAPEDPSPEGLRLGPRSVPTELEAATTLDWYGRFGPSEMPVLSISDLLAGRVAREEVAGRVIFVAATAAGTHDQRVTPLERAVPGVYIHATLAQNLLDGRHLIRPRHVLAIELALFLVVGLFAGLVMARFDVLGQLLSGVGMAAGWVLFDQLVLFRQGLVVYTVLPVVQIFLTLLAVALWRFLIEQRERRKTRQAFSRYLAPKVMEQVLAHPEQYLKLGGRRYEATVLFSDIRGFTTISEALTPEELGTLLNRYMTPMTNIVFKYEGTLDKYIGDAVMAFWGAPIELPKHALLACQAALEMIKKVEELNVEFEQASLPRIAIGIGLSSGPMTIGNMGSDDHLAYTALGDKVNLGSRLEGQTKDYGVDVIISDACYELVKLHMLCRELGALRVKGKYEPVRIYQLIGPLEECQGRITFVETFHLGLARYRDQRWDEAIEHFTRARALSGVNGDKCCDLYIQWCMEYKEEPPPAGWDGVRVATSK